MRKVNLILLLLGFALWCKAQDINTLITRHNANQTDNAPDKVYVQLDRTTYAEGDTLWFRAYLFDAVFLKASAKSNILYLELSDENDVVQVRRLVQLKYGIGWGSIPLTKRDFPEGGYTLRAYTQWMRNFDERLIFKQQFYVSNVDRYKWLINYNSAIKDNMAQLHVQLTSLNKIPIANQQILLGVRQDEAVLRRDKLELTSIFGGIELAVAIRDNPTPVYASLHKGSYDDKNEPVYKFPVIYNRPEKADVQFMPEGGYPVAGINSIIGVKAVGENGKGVNVSGSIVNSITNEQAAVFGNTVKGMASFSFTPQAGIAYKAIVNLPNGTKKEYLFPEVKPAGTVLAITNTLQSDSVTIKITASPGINNYYILLGQSREQVCFGAKVTLINNTKTIKAPKSAFASGIVRFTLLNDWLTTLNERIIYIDQKDNLNITVTPHQNNYSPQDSIALNIQVRDKNNNPVQGTFSMSVTTAQPDADKAKSTIVTNLLLTSDLKGDIEAPGYYLTKGHEQELDNLMLTQGWTGFDWNEISQPPKIEFKPEMGYAIYGKVDNLFGKPVKGAKISLMGLRPALMGNTETNEMGDFEFADLPLVDSSAFFLNSANAKGNKSTYDITLAKPQWPVFSKNKMQLPWYVNTDTTVLKIMDTVITTQSQVEKLSGMSNMLKEVTIRETRIIKNSFNLNGPGVADQVIDSRDIEKVPKTSLLELLKKKVYGFRVQGNRPGLRYFIRGSEIKGILFDGINPDQFHINWTELFDYYTSEDIIGIEVMDVYHASLYRLLFYVNNLPASFLEITTKGADGPFLKKINGFLMHRPPVLASAKEFYRPVYKEKNATAALFDQRTTIHWAPNIVTDKDGKATVRFYAAGQPATYNVITEGSNMDGNVGSGVSKISIK